MNLSIFTLKSGLDRSPALESEGLTGLHDGLDALGDGGLVARASIQTQLGILSFF